MKIVFENGYFPIEVIQQCIEGNLASYIDPDFLTLLVENKYLSNGEVVTEADLAAIRRIELTKTAADRGNLTSLAGIEYMSALQVLKCEYHQIETLDLSKNSELVELYVIGNGLTELNISNTPKLVRLYVQDNMISDIDLSDKPVLRLCYLGNNNLQSADLTGCSPSSLIGFTCSGNPGSDGKFVVKAWFDNSSIPANFTNSGWLYHDTENIEIIYENTMNN